ncbi:MAG: Na+ dependent nucleoside transporter N-terminal domain-containing protein, partial [Syntrophothermus sp.]
MNIITVFRGILGLVLILGIAFIFSNNKRRINWRLVGSGILFQLVFAIFIIHSETLRSWFFILGWPKDALNWMGGAVVSLLGYTSKGSEFVFGKLAIGQGSDFIFAFQVLPTIIFVSTLSYVLYYLGILQAVVRVMAFVMSKIMGSSGAESLSN